MLVEPCHITMLGDLRAQRAADHGGTAPTHVERFRTRQTGTLLAYLALHSDRSHSREMLADLFWPDAVPKDARQSLRQALASLRRQLEPPGPLIMADRTEVRLAPGAILTDVQRFEAALLVPSDLHRMRGAADAYGGEFLPGRYEEWVLVERTRLAEAYLRLLERLVARLQEAGDRETALDYARRALAHDPLREEFHGVVMRCLAQAGRSASGVGYHRIITATQAARLISSRPAAPTIERAAARIGA